MMVNALHRLPALETAGVRMLLNGPESFTPDGSFLLGEAAETHGLFLGCGMNSVGVATGGGAGMALAHCITDGKPPMDLHEVDPTRFPACFNSAEALAARAPEVLGRHYELSYPGRQWTTARNLRTTPLHDHWVRARAHFGQVAGWERPMYFGKSAEPTLTFGKPDWFDRVGAEVRQAHEGAALFDQSTFGKIEVSGSDTVRFLERVCSNRMERAVGRAIYTTMLNESGGIENDLTVVRLEEDRYRLYVGSSGVRRALSWMRRHAEGYSVTLTNRTEELAVIALMGPQAATVARRVRASALLELRYFRGGPTEIAGIPVDAVRLSYVGETGWELSCRVPDSGRAYTALLEAGALPAGTLAQTAMRIEKRFLSYGHDMDTDTSPLQAGLGFAIAWDTSFIGREALQRQRDDGVGNRIVTLLFDGDDRIVPLGNEPVYLDDKVAGKTTSAAYGYRIGRPLALTHMSTREAISENQSVEVNVAGTRFPARVLLGPAYDPEGARMRCG